MAKSPQISAARRLSSAAKPRATERRNLGPPRDFYGYGPNPPDPRWPGGARIAVNFNLNVEAGGEHSVLEGDERSEDMLTDAGYPPYPGVRSLMAESAFEYGPRVGLWRVLRILRRFEVRASVFAVV